MITSHFYILHIQQKHLWQSNILEARRCVRRRHYHLTVASVTGAAGLGPRWNTIRLGKL